MRLPLAASTCDGNPKSRRPDGLDVAISREESGWLVSTNRPSWISPILEVAATRTVCPSVVVRRAVAQSMHFACKSRRRIRVGSVCSWSRVLYGSCPILFLPECRRAIPTALRWEHALLCKNANPTTGSHNHELHVASCLRLEFAFRNKQPSDQRYWCPRTSRWRSAISSEFHLPNRHRRASPA